MKKIYLPPLLLGFFSALLICLPNNFSYAFAYIFAGEANGIGLVTHPISYTGAGGVLTLSVGIDPTSANATAMEVSVQNVITTMNSLTPTTGNLIFGGLNDIPASEVDFESTLLHELGHSLGLAHVNAATESGLAPANYDYTKATDGVDNTFNLDDGTDNTIGSDDDVRGDDIPLNYFRISNNDPFTIAGTVDGTTYSNSLTDLPVGDLYVANPDRTVGADLGYVNSEAVMQQGAFFDEDQRALGHDDVAGLRYAMAGVDEIAGTADDYTINLTYAGQDAGADIVIDFDNTQTGFAVSQNGASFVGTDHVAITSTAIFFNSTSSWYFSTAVLPVDWVHFAVEAAGEKAIVHWATSKEVNADYFEVERSLDQENWHSIASVNSSKTPDQGDSYKYVDEGAAEKGNKLYYRLRQIDIDGSAEYSKIQEVKFQRDAAEIITFGPIPVRTHSYVALHLMQTEPVKFTLRDISGREIKSWVSFEQAGYHEVRVGDQILSLSKGVYLMDVSSPSLQQTFKFVR